MFVLATISVIIVLIANELFQWYPVTLPPAVPAGLGAIGTLVLAFVTVKSLKQNKKLIEHQQTQLERQAARAKPVLRLVGKVDQHEDYEDFLVMELENIGGDKAINIYIEMELYVRAESETILFEEYIKKLEQSEIPPLVSRCIPLYKKDHVLQIGHSSTSVSGGVLEKNKTAEFSQRVDFSNPLVESKEEVGEAGYYPIVRFSRLIDGLKELDEDRMGFQFIITFEDIFGNSYEQVIWGPAFNTEELESLSDALPDVWWKKELDNKEGRRNIVRY